LVLFLQKKNCLLRYYPKRPRPQDVGWFGKQADMFNVIPFANGVIKFGTAVWNVYATTTVENPLAPPHEPLLLNVTSPLGRLTPQPVAVPCK
jgi:hypothetical protein